MTDDDIKAEYAARVTANVPAELKPLPVWLCWRYIGKEKDKLKRPKVPYYAGSKNPRAQNEELDSPKDRAQLVTFDVALAAYMTAQRPYDGLGIALGKVPSTDVHLSGIDLDDIALDDERAVKVLKVASSYAEVSPSGTGLKIFGYGDIGKEEKSKLHLEVYSEKRFFTITGRKL